GLPAIASLSIFQFLWTWNDLLVALTFGQNTQPITVWIAGQLREFGTSIDIIAPASFISLVIPLAVFLAFQRYFVQRLLAGSVKGRPRSSAAVWPGSPRTRRFATAVSSRRRSPSSRWRPTRPRPGGGGHGRSDSAGCARRATVTASRRRSP